MVKKKDDTSAPAWAWGQQFKQNGGFNSMLNKLKRAALGAHTPHDLSLIHI